MLTIYIDMFNFQTNIVYINRDKSFDPRFINFLKCSDIITFELLCYISFRIQFLVEPHLGHDGACGFIEMYLIDCIWKYASKRRPNPRDKNSVAGLLSDPRDQVNNNEIMIRYSERAHEYFYSRNGDLDRTLFEGIIESVCLACHIAMDYKKEAMLQANDIGEILGKHLYAAIPTYRSAADKHIEVVLCEVIKKMK